jgi:DNA-binding GntR family transcriptional regulator
VTAGVPLSVQESVLLRLREMIAGGRLRPGEQVVQEAVAAELGASVVPVREALRTLAGEGSLTYLPRRGYQVTRLSEEDLVELCAVRSVNEGLAVRRAVEQGLGDIPQRMAEALERMRGTGEPVEFAHADRDFHFALYAGCGMPRLLTVISHLWDQSAAYRSALFSRPEVLERNHVEHAEILEAVRRGDVPAVTTLLDAHRLSAAEAMLAPPPPTNATTAAG